MRRPKLLKAFSDEEYANAHKLLATRIASMMGRKLEEGDWNYVYCQAKDLPCEGWSNLNIDIMHQGLGVEHKMLCVRSKKRIKEHCGTTLMHPAATRAIRIPSLEQDATEVARDVLSQYAELVQQRYEKVSEGSTGADPDVRTGWLLWQESLREFLYFEEEMLAPNPADYWAEWRESGGGSRKRSRNLWVYETETDRKRFSITTTAGAKIQPYFDVPAPDRPFLYYFCVQGEELPGNLVRIWLTPTTALLLREKIGTLDTETISEVVINTSRDILRTEADIDRVHCPKPTDLAEPIVISAQAYAVLTSAFDGVSDEHLFQLLLQHISG